MTGTDTKRFEAAVDWVDSQISRTARAGFLGPGEPPWRTTSGEMILRYKIDYLPSPFDELTPITDRQDQIIAELVETNRGAFDLASMLSADYLNHGWQLPAGLKTFTILRLRSQLKQPPLETLEKNFCRNYIIFLYSTFAAASFGLYATRGDTDESMSGCDAVVKALARSGVHVGYRSAKDWIVGSKPNQVEFRARARTVMHEGMEFYKRSHLLFRGPNGRFTDRKSLCPRPLASARAQSALRWIAGGKK